MAELKQITIPDIGGFEGVDVIEVLVNPGDEVNAEDSIITLESDKASMDVPSPFAGVIKEVSVNVGDKVAEGDVIAMIEVATTAAASASEPKTQVEEIAEPVSDDNEEEVVEEKVSAEPSIQQVLVPDIGGFDDVDVIEVNVAAGDEVTKEQSLITLESDKASMEVPSPFDGKIIDVKLKAGDKVSQDNLILTMEAIVAEVKAKPASKPAPTKPQVAQVAPVAPSQQVTSTKGIYAGPAVRRFARELGVDLNKVKGTGRKGRIVKQDVQTFVKGQLQSKQGGGFGFDLPSAPKIDFAKFGEVELQPLSKINKISGTNLHRNWLQVPHITQFDEADITEMEEFRQAEKKNVEAQGYKLTPLVFIMKAVVAALQEFPRFNASLDPSGENLILKKYFHIGIAVDTPNGLVVAVIRDVDKKGFVDLAKELGEISEKARTKGLTPMEMQGGCFSISSLGGIGGTAFTPIVNVPEVAILGVSRSSMKPLYIDGKFEPRLVLPLSLSYDHRVIDGAEGARFSRYLVGVLSDIRNLLL